MLTHGEAKTSVPAAPVTLQGLGNSILAIQNWHILNQNRVQEKKGRETEREKGKVGRQKWIIGEILQSYNLG